MDLIIFFKFIITKKYASIKCVIGTTNKKILTKAPQNNSSEYFAATDRPDNQ